ncbi:hypothetical protein [Cereibacter azotoformans]|uniref:Sulfotransferase family protein n=1 Tax=Cereibacter azotoformans TaxID=43057 RepID=A0A2T5JKA8_9RHOB|nr:hypothetical protein [Cereibacter azotoformans]MBO4170795.1 hypothetical protein [Cereibacter azotoformans]PTR06931.1 hypothetical protein C8J28_1461 [Cereibacter azotoformans]
MTSSCRSTQKSGQKVAVLVLGMHRSGTSMLGGMLDRLGCQGAKTQLKATPSNPKGYFESSEFMKLNDSILATLGSRWDDWRPFEQGWQNSPRFVEFRERIAETMAAEYGSASLIYLKDPRICRLMPLWREALVEAGYAPVCIHTHRNPQEVLQSLAARKGVEVEPELGMLAWLRHVLDAEAGSRGLPRIFTSYARLLSNWTEFSDRAEKVFGFSWPVARNARDDRVRDMIDRGLRHHDSSIEDLMNDASVPERVKDCLKVMERWTRDGEDDEGRETLIRIASEFETSAALFGGSVIGLAAKCRKARGSEEKLEALDRELKEREEEIAARQAELDTLRNAHARLAARDAEREAEIQDQKARIVALREERDRLEQDRETLRAQDALLREELRQTGDRLMQLRAEKELVSAEFQEKLAAAAAALQEAEQRFVDIHGRYVALEEKNALDEAALRENRKLAEITRIEAEDRIRTLNTELSAFADTTIEQGRALVRLNSELAALKGEKDNAVAAAEKRARALHDEVGTLTARISEHEKIIREANDKIASHDNELSATREQLGQEQEKAFHMIERLHQEYRSSTSWRVTAPVRAVGQLIRGSR